MNNLKVVLLSILILTKVTTMAQEKDKEHWQNIYNERTAFMETHFGELPKDILKVKHLIGVWPGGGMYKIQASKLGKGLWVYTTFGLSNPDMPTEVAVSKNVDATTSLIKKENIPSYPDRFGYGYELMIITKESEEWPLQLLQWAINIEILQDVDILGRVEKYNGLTIEDIQVGEESYMNVLISKAHSPLPTDIKLSTGKAEILVATIITDDEMKWSMKNGRDALVKALKEQGDGQISHPNRSSIFHPTKVDLSEVKNIEQAKSLFKKGLLRKTYLFPLDAGGEDADVNTVFVPKSAALKKKWIDEEILQLAAEGKIENYSAKPVYKEDSFIPIKIEIEATGEVTVKKTIDVWK